MQYYFQQEDKRSKKKGVKRSTDQGGFPNQLKWRNKTHRSIHLVKGNQDCWWQVFLIKLKNIMYTKVQDYLKVFSQLEICPVFGLNFSLITKILASERWVPCVEFQITLLGVGVDIFSRTWHSQRPKFTTNSINWYVSPDRTRHEQKIDKLIIYNLIIYF